MAPKNSKQMKIEEVIDNGEKPAVLPTVESKKEDKKFAVTKKTQSKEDIKKETEQPAILENQTNAEVAAEPEFPKPEVAVSNKKIEKSKKTAVTKTDKKQPKAATKNGKKNETNKKGKGQVEEVKKPTRVKRVKASYEQGLTSDQVKERVEKGQTNKTPNTNVKTYRAIFFENIFTFFNILCIAVSISLIVVGSFSNLLFMAIILANITIGIIQEIKAKKTIEKLSLLTAPAVKVVRDGKEQTISVDEVVIDDVVILTNGKQIVADSVIIEGTIEVNESMLTGESLPIKKKVGDTVLAGSFVVSGSCHVRVEKVGSNNYIQQLASKAKQYKKPQSELFNSLKQIIRVIAFILIPIAILMYINNYTQFGDIKTTVEKTAGSVIGMIPAGMFLLCSVTLTVSVIKLARRKALVQDLYCVEMLARVNVLCLDKTGTITDGTMKVYNCIQLNNTNYTLKRIMGSLLSALGDNNQTSQALINYFGYNKELKPVATVPFSSARKLSAVSFENAGTYIMGAPDFVIPSGLDEKTQNMVEQYSKDGYRVLLLAYSPSNIIKDNPPSNRTPVALLILEDRIRDDAASTIKWFKENDVEVKIISGDNPLTVAEIAKRVGVDNTDKLISLEGLNEKQVIAAANKYTVFGRVTPEQKAILVKAIKSNGNTVAMTGDGVNDILALKEADCSIAMASGSEAVRSVSHMVLLNSDFGSMPETVLEGRRVINNVQRASALFFMKTIFAIVFSIFVLAIMEPYPLEPIQMILLESLVIGLPSFFLAFLPNTKRIQGKFIYNLIKNALPGALALIINSIAIYAFFYFGTGALPSTEILSTMVAITLTFTGLAVLYRLCKPITLLTGLLFFAMLGLCFIGVFAFSDFFKLAIGALSLSDKLFAVILIIVAPTLLNVLYKLMDKIRL